jgi:hypothetical protein
VTVCSVEEDLGGDIVWSATDCLFALAWAFDQCCEAKVADFDVHVSVEEEITELEVAVNDLVCVHVVTGADELNHKEAGLALCEATTTTEHVHKGTGCTELKSHVDVFLVFEAFLEGHDIRVLK